MYDSVQVGHKKQKFPLPEMASAETVTANLKNSLNHLKSSTSLNTISAPMRKVKVRLPEDATMVSKISNSWMRLTINDPAEIVKRKPGT